MGGEQYLKMYKNVLMIMCICLYVPIMRFIVKFFCDFALYSLKLMCIINITYHDSGYICFPNQENIPGLYILTLCIWKKVVMIKHMPMIHIMMFGRRMP